LPLGITDQLEYSPPIKRRTLTAVKNNG